MVSGNLNEMSDGFGSVPAKLDFGWPNNENLLKFALRRLFGCSRGALGFGVIVPVCEKVADQADGWISSFDNSSLVTFDLVKYLCGSEKFNGVANFFIVYESCTSFYDIFIAILNFLQLSLVRFSHRSPPIVVMENLNFLDGPTILGTKYVICCLCELRISYWYVCLWWGLAWLREAL